MTTELTMLGWTLVLALAQIMIAAALRTSETGLAYNMSARDEPAPPMRPVTARLQRAQANLFETLPIFAAAVIMAHIAGKVGTLTALGAHLYFFGRLIYLPLYAFGVPVARSLVWLASVIGIGLILAALVI
jgi:uncharacterized MAPEG superfamily protein